MNFDEIEQRYRKDPDNPENVANLLRMLMRKGEIPQDVIKDCAQLGDTACYFVFPTFPILRFTDFLIHKVTVPSDSAPKHREHQRMFMINFILWIVEKSLTNWYEIYPENDLPLELLEILKRLNNTSMSRPEYDKLRRELNSLRDRIVSYEDIDGNFRSLIEIAKVTIASNHSFILGDAEKASEIYLKFPHCEYKTREELLVAYIMKDYTYG